MKNKTYTRSKSSRYSYKSKLNKLYESFNHDDKIAIRNAFNALKSSRYSENDEYDMMCCINAYCLIQSTIGGKHEYIKQLQKLFDITPNWLQLALSAEGLDVMKAILRHTTDISN